MELRAVRGMHDLYGEELNQWRAVEEKIIGLFRQFGFTEIRTPVLEKVDVFLHTVGEETDIVGKQMYTLETGSERLVLRPEGTASFIRAVVEHSLQLSSPKRYFYYLPMFRHERPQKGRLRQFHQFGGEIIQDPSPEADSEIIFFVDSLYRAFELTQFELRINSVGCLVCRSEFRNVLKTFLQPQRHFLCEECQKRFDLSILRVLDCKNETCKKLTENAPAMALHLCQQCLAHHGLLKKSLSELGIAYIEDPRIVRGLDYYCRTAFEFTSELLGAQSALAGGGRYDGLSERFGEKPFPAVGFAMGMERFLVALNEKGKLPKCSHSPHYFFAALGESAFRLLFPLSLRLKKSGVWTEMSYQPEKSLKTLLKYADRTGAKFTVLIGENELKNSEAILKNMSTGEQEAIRLSQLEENLKRRANRAL